MDQSNLSEVFVDGGFHDIRCDGPPNLQLNFRIKLEERFVKVSFNFDNIGVLKTLDEAKQMVKDVNSLKTDVIANFEACCRTKP